MKALGYIRVSTEAQADDGISLEAQKAKVHAWADLHDCQLVDVFADAGISGSKADNRPGLQKAVSMACKHKAALVVYSLSRLARSTLDAIRLSEQLSRSGADLVSLTEQLDTTTAAGKMVFRLLAVLAEFERDQLGERTRTAMRYLQRQGRRVSRYPPFGWDLSDDKDMLVPNAAEQETLAMMRELREHGLSYRHISLELEQRGIPTKQGGSRWSPKVVRGILIRGDAA